VQRKEHMNMRDAGMSIHDMAAYWMVTLKSPELPPAMLKRWEKWIAEPANRAAFDEAQQLWEIMDDVPPPAWPSDAEVARDTYDGSMSVEAFEEQRRRHRRYWTAGIGLAAVASMAAVALGVMGVLPGSVELPSERMTAFETAVSQHERVSLIDGSEIHMGGRTAVTTNLARKVRFVVVDRGEARFEVAHDPKRPFRVLAGAGVITAVGTAFNVRRLDNMVIVTVIEGTVDVAPASAVNAREGGDYSRGKRVTHGEYITYDGDGNLAEVRRLEPGASSDWRSGRLQYRSEPLNRVVQDINRYSKKTIVIDTAAGDMIYSGTVFERDVDYWLDALDKVFPELQITHPDTEHVVIRQKGKTL
jgi:transmembrane sensor